MDEYEDDNPILSLVEMRQELNCLKHEVAVSFDGWDSLIKRFQSIIANAKAQERFNQQVSDYLNEITSATNQLDARLDALEKNAEQ
jgi:hypothetical protein